MSLSLPKWLLEHHLEGTELTPRERAVLRGLARGLTVAEVAAEQGRSFETVKAQVRTARARLKARNIAHAVAIAISLDLI